MVAAKAVLSFLFPWPQVWNYVSSWNFELSLYQRVASSETEQFEAILAPVWLFMTDSADPSARSH